MDTMYDVTVVANNLIGPALEADTRFTLPVGKNNNIYIAVSEYIQWLIATVV